MSKIVFYVGGDVRLYKNINVQLREIRNVEPLFQNRVLYEFNFGTGLREKGSGHVLGRVFDGEEGLRAPIISIS